MRNALDNRKPLKKKPCKVCKELFQPFSTLAKTCSVKCAVEQGRLDRERLSKKAHKEFKAETRIMKQSIKTRAKWLSECQTACNAFIRERDKNESCISCGTQKPDIQYCAGHFKSRGGHPELRFHPWNIHKQCNQYCNCKLSGNISAYKPRLEEKLGKEAVEWLEGKHEAQNWSIEDISDIKDFYKEQLKYIKA